MFAFLVIGEDLTNNTETSIVFFAGTEIESVKCVEIVTNADSIVEGDEIFQVSITSTNAAPSSIVQIGTPDSQFIVIQDNSGMILF